MKQGKLTKVKPKLTLWLMILLMKKLRNQQHDYMVSEFQTRI